MTDISRLKPVTFDDLENDVSAKRKRQAADKSTGTGVRGGYVVGKSKGTTTGAPSDRRLKRDIEPVGTLPNGLALYRYRYLWSDQVYVGVMAQEVLDVVPDAVLADDRGYMRVDYAQLGTRLMTWQEWQCRTNPETARAA